MAVSSPEDPSVSAANPIESKEAIKIPGHHKKPLRRVDVGHLLADMKRIPALLLLQIAILFALLCLLQLRGSDKKCPPVEEALKFYNIHFHLRSQ